MFKAGDIFIGKYPPGSNKDRRVVIVTDEDASGQIAIVYLSTQLSDLTTVFHSGDHPCITEDCCVVYDEAAVADATLVHAGLADRLIRKHHERLAPQIVIRIQEGVFDSAPDRVADFCKDRC